MTNQARANILKGGLSAGLFGAVLLWLIMAADAVLQGMDGWGVFKVAAAPFVGEVALQPGFDGIVVLIGILSHLAVSVVWGLIFSALFYGLSKIGTLIAGLLWGFAVWIGMFYVVLPLLGWSVIAQHTPVGRAIGYHLLFGLGLGLGFLPFQHPRIEIRVSHSDV